MDFKNASPEECGISSSDVLNFIKTLDSYGLATHGFIMARGDKIFSEGYYAPYCAQSKHRMYSVSKSFIALAVGLAVEDGLLSLDDKIVDFFPEYEIDKFDENLAVATVKDHLTMRSSMLTEPDWWGKPDRVACYFKQKSKQIPGTNFNYDSAGSFLLSVIVEKLTGKPMMEYLKDRCLRELGFSEDSYCLLAPGGHSHADSGVMCTSRDLLVFARLMLSGGKIGGKRYISEKFAKDAVSFLTDNVKEQIPSPLCTDKGYGYLIWKMPRDGFAFVGMADQYAVCDPKTDFIFIINSCNHKSSNGSSRFLIMHELYKSVIEKLGEPLSENKKAISELRTYEKELQLVHLSGGVKDNIASEINGVSYTLSENPMGISEFKLEFSGDGGAFVYVNGDGVNRLEFALGKNRLGIFPGKRRMSKTASVYEDGNYSSATSAIWCERAKFRISSRITDTFIGETTMTFGFKGDGVSVYMSRHAQRILDSYDGSAVGTRKM